MEDFYDKTEEQDESPAPRKRGVLERSKTMAYSAASLILAMMSLVCCCTGAVSTMLGVAAIVLAILSSRHLGYFDTMALLGLVLGIMGTVFGLFIFISDLFSGGDGFKPVQFDSQFSAYLK